MHDHEITTNSEEQQAETTQPTQEELRRLYIEQQRRLACPGCGESNDVIY